MMVDPAKAQWRHEHDGAPYFFCSAGCMKQFAADPAKYLAPPAPRRIDTPDAHPPAVEYFCPMDPEIVLDHQGVCPKCGMALQPRVLTLAAEAEPDPELRDMTRRFWVSAALALPVLFLSMSEIIPGHPLQHALGMGFITWIEFVLATPVVLWGAAPFFVRAARSIVTRKLNMFTLIGLGVGIAYGAEFAFSIPHSDPRATRTIPRSLDRRHWARG